MAKASNQAPADAHIDPLRLLYKGQPLFSPANTVQDGFVTVFDRYNDPLSRKLATELESMGANHATKCLPNMSVIMEMTRDSSAQCTLAPTDLDDDLYDPVVLFRKPGEEEQALFCRQHHPNLLMAQSVGFELLLALFDEPHLTLAEMMSNEATNPEVRRLSLEANQVRGVCGFSWIMPYAAVFWIAPTFADAREKVLAELLHTLRRTLGQVRQARIADEYRAAQKG
jgi:hypothetical protein